MPLTERVSQVSTVAGLILLAWIGPAAAQTVSPTAVETAAVAGERADQGRPAAPPRRPRTRRFAIDAHFGGLLSSNPSGSTVTLPPVGNNTFAALDGVTTRAVSSWYFGDGPSLFNENAASRALPATITALDPAITTSSVTRHSGISGGARVEVALNPRWSVEGGIDFGAGHVAFTSGAKSAIDATSNSFQTAFPLLFSASGFQSSTATSTETFVDNSGTQLLATGVVKLNLTTRGSLRLAVLAGLGVSASMGPPVSVTLVGNYMAQPAGAPSAINDTDTVTLTFHASSTFVTVFGGALTHPLSERTAVRVDVRAYLSGNGTTATLDARPSVATALPGLGFVVALAGSPTLQFSNSQLLTQFKPSLSGPLLSDVLVATGSGTRLQTAITFAYVMRF